MKKIFYTLLTTLLFIGSTSYSTDADALSREHQQAFLIEDSLVRFVKSVDTNRFRDLKKYFTDTVFIDLSEENGEPPKIFKINDLIARFEGALQDIDTHHTFSNFVIDVHGKEADADVHAYAIHSIDGVPYWDFYGRYLFGLEKVSGDWKINSLTFVFYGQEGDRNFYKRAQK